MGDEPDREILKMVARTTIRTKLYEALADQLTDIVVNSIITLRRAKRRNMERLVLACGGKGLNSVGSLTRDCLGWAGLVYEHVLGEEKYTFVENVKNPHSCTIVIKGPNDHTIAQIKDAVRDGLRAVKNTIEDEAVVLGAGAFELATRKHLINEVKKTVKGGEHSRDNIVGINLQTGGTLDPQMEFIFDNYSVKRQLLNSGPVIASQLLLVDEVIRAGLDMRKPN